MKHLILSVLAVLTLMGSASALSPGPEDRKAMCQRNPEKYVWVEKDQFCVPKNPCESVNWSVKDAYCVTKFTGIQTRDDSMVNDIITRYLEKVRQIKAESIVFLGDESGDPYKDFAVKTSDDSYLVFRFYGQHDHDFTTDMEKAACWAYGGEHSRTITDGHYECANISSKELCEDIGDFASLLYGNNISAHWDSYNNTCDLSDGF